MPEEVYSERNCLANNGTLSKVLFYDIVRQLCWPTGLASVNADNCYNRIAHPMALMIFQAFGIPTKAIASMLLTIQRMRFFLCIGYGDPRIIQEVVRKVWMIQSGHMVCVRVTWHLPPPGWSQVSQ
jgi:hypothetical protein